MIIIGDINYSAALDAFTWKIEEVRCEGDLISETASGIARHAEVARAARDAALDEIMYPGRHEV